jgi:hypothetical protein
VIDLERIASVVVGLALYAGARALVRRLGPRRYTIELGRFDPRPGGVRGVHTHAGAEVPELVHRATELLSDYGREHPELESARIVVEVPR